MTTADGSSIYHIPVLARQAVDLLVTRRDGVYIDGTLGGGGHSEQILAALEEGGRLFGFDQDEEAIAHAVRRFASDGRMTVVRTNTVRIHAVLEQYHIETVDGILMDLGMSSRQIDSSARGFSFQLDGPLDMRMDTQSPRTAAAIVNSVSRDELADIIFRYGEERRSRRIADAIIRARHRSRIETTGQLAAVVRSAIPVHHADKALARVFQALRIEVNNELGILDHILADAAASLRVGGRFVVISYHSLEDRAVKTFFRNEAATCVCPPHLPVCVCGKVQRMKILTSKSIVPDEDEIRRNPRSRSARLRAAEKVHA